MRNSKLESVNGFVTYLEKERHFSLHSIKSYSIDLAQFCEFLDKYSDDEMNSFNEVDKAAVTHYLGYLFEKGLSSRTVARKLAAIKSFYKYLLKAEEVSSNPASGVKYPKFEQRLPDFLSKDVLEKVLNAPSSATWEGLRDRAILELFYSSGIRLSELVQMSVESVNQNQFLIRVMGKGKKERVIPVGKTAVVSINAYLKSRESEYGSFTNDDPLFISNRGTRISPRTVQSRMKKYMDETALGMKFHPHLLRHTFATHLVDQGADIRAVKELLGHSSLSSTQKYTHLKVEQLKKVYKQTHPHA